MATIDLNNDKFEISKAFKKDMKNFKHDNRVKNELSVVLDMLINDKEIPDKYKQHPLTGDMKGYFDIHVLPDVILIYGFSDGKVQLGRIGNHAKLKLTEQIIRLLIRE